MSFKRNLRIVLAIATTSIVVFIAVAILLGTPSPHAVIDFRATLLRQIVERPLVAEFAIKDLERLSVGTECAPLFDGLDAEQQVTIRPEIGTDIVYRWRKNVLSVRLQSGDGVSTGTARTETGSCNLHARATFVIAHEADETEIIFPLAGPVSAGSETIGSDQTGGFFYGGRVHLFGRALLPPHRGALYPVTSSPLLLAEGGRVSSALNLQEGASWYGVARVTDAGLAVSVTADTDLITVVRPGGSGEIEPLGIGMLSQLFNDPSIAPITLGLVFVTSAIHLGIALTAMLPSASTDTHQDKPEMTDDKPDDTKQRSPTEAISQEDCSEAEP
tara:strand:- start:167974 stop:168966 length:993 start_codon:yes stop_codon:yes gene_type:complete